MAYKGKIQLTIHIVAPPDQVEEGDRLFGTHGPWMEATHHRDGDKALLSYNVSKAPEVSNPMDPNADPTGNTVYILSENLRDGGWRGGSLPAGRGELAGLPGAGQVAGALHGHRGDSGSDHQLTLVSSDSGQPPRLPVHLCSYQRPERHSGVRGFLSRISLRS